MSGEPLRQLDSARSLLLELDKEDLVNLILENVPEAIINDRVRDLTDSRRLARITAELNKRVQEEMSEVLQSTDRSERPDMYNPVFRAVARVYDRLDNQGLFNDAQAKPFFVLEVLVALIQTIWKAQGDGETHQPQIYPLEDLDCRAVGILRAIGDRETLTRYEEKVITLVAKNFPLQERFRLLRDYGYLENTFLQSGNLALEILTKIRQRSPAYGKKKRVRLDAGVHTIDMASKCALSS